MTFCLALGGVYQAVAVTYRAGALLPHPFTLTNTETVLAVSFLWHYPSGRPGLPLTTTVLYRVQTFLGSARWGTSPLVHADAIAMVDSLARKNCSPSPHVDEIRTDRTDP